MTHDTLPLSNMVAPQLPSLIDGKLLGEPAPGLTLCVSALYLANRRCFALWFLASEPSELVGVCMVPLSWELLRSPRLSVMRSDNLLRQGSFQIVGAHVPLGASGDISSCTTLQRPT